MPVEVQPLSGFRDFSQKAQAQRLWLIDTAFGVYRQFGYHPIETPALERNEIMAGQYGEEGDKLRYTFTDHGNRRVGMRYDLTVPFARYVAYALPRNEISLPFRRSQVGPVWRAESAQIQAGRFREFYQCDFDIAGSTDPVSDAEVVMIAANLLDRLQLDFRLRINHRGVLDAILRSIGAAPEHAAPILIALDKIDKIGGDAVRTLLTEEIKLTPTQVDQFFNLIEQGFDEQRLHASFDETGQAALAELIRIHALATAALPAALAKRIAIDLSIVRGLSYYTGLVLESTVIGQESFGSVLSGGRYDNTIGTFLGRQIPAVGASLGVDRCLAVLDKLKLLPEEAGRVTAAVIAFRDSMDEAFALAGRLRQANISTTFLITEGKLGPTFKQAEQQAQFAVIAGRSEVDSGTYQVKDLARREQQAFSEAVLITYLKQRS